MPTCHTCAATVGLPYRCRRCERSFCSDHRMPEAHCCPGKSPTERRPQIRRLAVYAVAAVAIVAAGMVAGAIAGGVSGLDADIGGAGGLSLPDIGSSDADIESEVFDAVNEYRADIGVSELTHDDALETAAREHSVDMVERDYFDHDSPDGSTPETRTGPACGQTHEVIAEIQYSDSGAVAVELWQESPGHDPILRDSRLSRAGVGVESDGGARKVTMKLC